MLATTSSADIKTVTDISKENTITTTKKKSIKEIEVPIELFTYETDPSILQRLYEETTEDECEVGTLEDLLKLPKAEFTKAKEEGVGAKE